MNSLFDTINIARFHIVKALRTRSFFFLCVVYMLLSGVAAWFCREMVSEFEKHTAELLKVPQTKTPGTMMETIRENDDFRRVIQTFLPDSDLLDWALSVPVLTLSYFWISLGCLATVSTRGLEGIR